jgi:hypothetical protein
MPRLVKIINSQVPLTVYQIILIEIRQKDEAIYAKGKRKANQNVRY